MKAVEYKAQHVPQIMTSSMRQMSREFQLVVTFKFTFIASTVSLNIICFIWIYIKPIKTVCLSPAGLNSSTLK